MYLINPSYWKCGSSHLDIINGINAVLHNPTPDTAFFLTLSISSKSPCSSFTNCFLASRTGVKPPLSTASAFKRTLVNCSSTSSNGLFLWAPSTSLCVAGLISKDEASFMSFESQFLRSGRKELWNESERVWISVMCCFSSCEMF